MGWTARVDGKPAKVWKANYAYRAVEVPEGVSRVELSYWSPGLTAGLIVSALSALALLGLTFKRSRIAK